VAFVAVMGEMKLGSWRATGFKGAIPWHMEGSVVIESVGVVMRRWMQSWVARLELICGAADLEAISCLLETLIAAFPLWNGLMLHIAETASPP